MMKYYASYKNYAFEEYLKTRKNIHGSLKNQNEDIFLNEKETNKFYIPNDQRPKTSHLRWGKRNRYLFSTLQFQAFIADIAVAAKQVNKRKGMEPGKEGMKLSYS